MNYWRRYIGDYGRDTTRLTLAEHGAYGLLLDYYYAEEQPIPLDLDEVCRMVRAITPAERKAVERVLNTYFVKAADGYHNERADHEIEVSRKARDNGSKGGRPRTEEETEEETGRRTGDETGEGTGRQTGEGGGSGHPPTTNLQPPTTSLPTATRQSEKRTAGRGKRATADRKNGQSKTGPTEQAYVTAYTQRYHVAPVINGKVRGMLSRFIDRVPAAEAPLIAGFYVSSDRGLYVSSNHCVDLLLRDAEGLRTQWATGRHGTDTEARIADRTRATGNAFSGLLKESDHAH